jgi:hypothetical protein
MTDALSPTVTTTDDNEVTAVITGEFDIPRRSPPSRPSRGP